MVPKIWKNVLNAYKLVGRPVTVMETISICDKCEIEKKNVSVRLLGYATFTGKQRRARFATCTFERKKKFT